MPSGGFIAVRRGLLEHLRRGKLTELEALTFIIILGLANPHSGIWWGSAKSLWGEYPFYGNERRARRALEGLASKWYIKRLSTPGKHSNYPILIDKYEVKVGEKVGLRLNARKSRNERSLCYEKNGTQRGEGELGVIHGGEQVVEVGVFGEGKTGQNRRASGREVELKPDLSKTSQPLKKEKENENKKEKRHKPVCALFEIWNQHRGELSEALKLTTERARKCKARLKTHEAHETKFLVDFQQAVQQAAKTPFLLGQSARGWKASFDWLIANDTNYLAILEGKYSSEAGQDFKKLAWSPNDDKD